MSGRCLFGLVVRILLVFLGPNLGNSGWGSFVINHVWLEGSKGIRLVGGQMFHFPLHRSGIIPIYREGRFCFEDNSGCYVP